MARPKGWNGSAWVDAKFWNGSTWKQYIAPTYTDDANGSYYGFGTTVEDWAAQSNTYSGPANWVTGGYCRAEVEPGLMGYVYLRSPNKYLGDLNGQRTVYGRARINIESQAGATSPNPIKCSLAMLRGLTEVAKVSWNVTPGSSTGYIVRQTSNFVVNDGQQVQFEAYAGAGALSGYGTCKITVDYAELIDVATGQRLKQLSNVPWQPYVWNGSKWI